MVTELAVQVTPKAVEKAAWGVPPEHPDLVPVAEAARLVDIYRSLAELEEVFVRLMEKEDVHQ